MDDRPILLDLYSCAGGAAVGYDRAGFRVIGIDIDFQPNYPFEFHQGDAIKALQDLVWNRGYYAPNEGLAQRVAAVHASPPCQRYSAMTTCRPELAGKYPDLIPATRLWLDKLQMVGPRPTVIENVPGAPLRNDLELCGQMFGRELYRHRIFETNFPVQAPVHPAHVIPASKAGHWTPGTIMSVSGHIAPIAHARKIMDINWTTRAELAESIPPYYTEFVGAQIMSHLKQEASA